MAWGAGPEYLSAQKGLELRIIDSGAPWRFAFGANGGHGNPLVVCTLEGVLREMLHPWPRNFNPPVTIIHFGRLLEDNDGTADLLRSRAERLWDSGAPGVDSDRLRWLRWWIRQGAEAADPGNGRLGIDPPVLSHMAAETVERCVAGYCIAENLWAPLMPHFLGLSTELRYRPMVVACSEFFEAEGSAGRTAALARTVDLALAAIDRAI